MPRFSSWRARIVFWIPLQTIFYSLFRPNPCPLFRIPEFPGVLQNFSCLLVLNSCVLKCILFVFLFPYGAYHLSFMFSGSPALNFTAVYWGGLWDQLSTLSVQTANARRWVLMSRRRVGSPWAGEATCTDSACWRTYLLMGFSVKLKDPDCVENDIE